MARVLVSTDGLSREDWLKYRRLGIGGSDASVICGVNRYKSPIELWLEKTGQAPEQEAGEAAYWGSTLEGIIRTEFTKRTGIPVVLVNHILQSKEHPFMIANLDGVCKCPTHGKCVVEIKTAGAFKAAQWEDDAVPYEYVLQVHHYISVTGYNGAYIAVLLGGNTFLWKFVQRDEAVINMLVQREAEFWDHVKDDIPPAPDGSDACVEFLNKRYPKCVPKSKITLPDNAADLIRDYSEACAQLDIFTEQKQRAANLLKEMLGTNEAGVVGENSISWKTVTQDRFDSKTLQAEQPTLYSKYIKSSSHRRFIIKAAS